MRIGGLEKQSLLDYPGKISSIIFTIGCNFRCPYCHNPELIGNAEELSEKQVLAHLDSHKKFLDAVVITGGEPTLQPDLEQFIKKVKKLGYSVKLDTNGSHPAKLKSLVKQGLIDYVAMDVKAPIDFKKQNTSVGGAMSKDMFEKVKESIDFLEQTSLPHEFRTTVVPGIHTPEDIVNICSTLKNTERYAIQQFRPDKTLDPSYSQKKPFPKETMNVIKKECEKYIKHVELRGV
ncbi:anaerobic ribonucleoside-triphosphate reductase activating protein [archaeon]|nr:anaerobic ribonucleoside-triphosphate reductase activating protein [archaeon]